MKITISKQFQDLIYPLTDEEFHLLEQSLLKHGVRDPLVVWETRRAYLIDGHHRKQLIDKHKITKYRVTKLRFNNKYEVINWILDSQLGRRNASPEGVSYLRGLRYKNEKLQHGGNRKSSGNSCNLKTSESLAEQYKVSGRTIINDEKFADAIESIVKAFPTPAKQKEVKHKILTRQINLSKKDIVELAELPATFVKQVMSGKKELWQVKLEIEQRREKRKKKPVRIVLPKEIKMYCGDCVDVMKKMKANTFSSALLDPPYGWPLGKKKNNFTPAEIDRYGLIEQAYFVGDRSPALKAGLYDLSYEGGRKYKKWCSDWGKELLRVMKPGGHALVFCSTKMLHRLTVGLEDVGWEVKNILTWVFGTGFPVSIGLNKQIDNLLGQKGNIICENPNRKNRVNWNKNEKNIVTPASPEAQQWEGWFNNIKNSFEPILLVRKPLAEKTLAENVLKWGVGALNIDGCRVGNNGGTKAVSIKKGEGNRAYNTGDSSLVEVQGIGKGRFPANVILSEDGGKELNRQAGLDVACYFYCSKPSGKEKEFGVEDTGNTHPTVKPVSLCSYLLKLINPPQGKVLDLFAGSGTVGMACAMNNFQYHGIEIEREYYLLAKRRMMAAYKKQQGK